MASKKPYTLPKLIRSKSNRSVKGDWYIEYFYEYPDQPGVFKSYKVRDGINYIDDIELKEIEAQQLLKDVTYALQKENFNPFQAERMVEIQIAEAKNKIEQDNKPPDQWTIAFAIKQYITSIEADEYSTTTLYAYKKYLVAFENWAFLKEQTNFTIADFTELQVQKYLDELFKDKKWSTRTYNNYLKFMITFFQASQRLERLSNEDRAIRYNFDPTGLKLKKTTAQRNKAFTPILENKIKIQIKDFGYNNLYDYVEWISLSLMRPDEIRHLKVADIDHVNRHIRVIGKTGDRLVPISDQLLMLITRRNLLISDHRCFVFGYMGNVDTRRMSVAYFLLQFAELSKKLNLDSNYGPYSFKPTAIIKMIKAGFKDEDIMIQTGHKTVEAFRAYKRDLVIDNDHVMKGDVIEF